MIDTIYLDMDGVLADFVGGACELFNFDTTKIDNWDMPKTMGISDKEFWSVINQKEVGFWAELERYPWANDLVAMCHEYTDNVIVLSDSSGSKFTYEGKRAWMEYYYPDIPLYLVEEKWRLAKSSCLLIDDKPSTLHSWHAEGGWGCLFPQPWAGYDVLNIMEHMKHTLGQYTNARGS